MTSVRKSLHPLQPAAGSGDKENLVGSGRMIPADKDNLKSLRETTNANEKVSTPVSEAKVSSNKRKKVAGKFTQVSSAKPVITEEDLTSTGEPSENYWKRLSERQRLALEETLAENEELHNKVACLQEEKKELQDKVARLEEKKELHKKNAHLPEEKLYDKLAHLEEEKKDLQDTVSRLQEENNIYKGLLEEQGSLVEVLKEMLNDPADESVNINDSIDG